MHRRREIFWSIIGGCSVRQGRVLQARSEGSVRLYSTRAASDARREIARNAPPKGDFLEYYRRMQCEARSCFASEKRGECTTVLDPSGERRKARDCPQCAAEVLISQEMRQNKSLFQYRHAAGNIIAAQHEIIKHFTEKPASLRCQSAQAPEQSFQFDFPGITFRFTVSDKHRF